MIFSKRQQRPRNTDIPSEERILETGFVKRCGVCWREWSADQFTIEDGQERCPTCVDTRTAEYKADRQTQESEFAASREPKPQISQAPLASTFPGTIRQITDENGVRIYDSSKLSLIRNVAKTLLLLGRSFSATDTITGSTGITIVVDARTATQTDLSITADLTMTPGDYYGITFNDVVFRNIFSVR